MRTSVAWVRSKKMIIGDQNHHLNGYGLILIAVIQIFFVQYELTTHLETSKLTWIALKKLIKIVEDQVLYKVSNKSLRSVSFYLSMEKMKGEFQEQDPSIQMKNGRNMEVERVLWIEVNLTMNLSSRVISEANLISIINWKEGLLNR